MAMESLTIKLTPKTKAAWNRARAAADKDVTAGDLLAELLSVHAEGRLKEEHPERAATLEAYDACVARLRSILAGAMDEADVRQDEAVRESQALAEASIKARERAEEALRETQEHIAELESRIEDLEAENASLRAQGELYERLSAMLGNTSTD